MVWARCFPSETSVYYSRPLCWPPNVCLRKRKLTEKLLPFCAVWFWSHNQRSAHHQWWSSTWPHPEVGLRAGPAASLGAADTCSPTLCVWCGRTCQCTVWAYVSGWLAYLCVWVCGRCVLVGVCIQLGVGLWCTESWPLWDMVLEGGSYPSLSLPSDRCCLPWDVGAYRLRPLRCVHVQYVYACVCTSALSPYVFSSPLYLLSFLLLSLFFLLVRLL